MFSRIAGVAVSAALALFVLVGAVSAAAAQPQFPALTGRVVDNANLLSTQQEAALSSKLQALETRTRDQLVVVTLPTLQGYEIEEYGYQLGRHWGIGQKESNSGAILIVAPNERRVRVEVGYGLEGVLTDALSATIIQSVILPRFREGDFPGGIDRGVDAIVEQLTLDPEEARQRAALAEEQAAVRGGDAPMAMLIGFLLIFFIVPGLLGAFGRRGRRRRNSWVWMGPGIGGGWGGGGGGGFGGGGFGGGGGSFGGGGASGGW